VAGYSERSNEPFGSIKGGEFLERLSIVSGNILLRGVSPVFHGSFPKCVGLLIDIRLLLWQDCSSEGLRTILLMLVLWREGEINFH
jgi:hypothetical protein